MPSKLEALMSAPPPSMEVAAGEQILTLARPGMSATNEILAVLLSAPQTREIVGKVTGEVQGHIEGAQRLVDEALRRKLAETTSEAERDAANRIATRMRAEVALETGVDFASRTLGTLAGSLFDLLLPLIRDHGGLSIAAIALDNRKNRKALAADSEWCAEWGDPRKLAELNRPGVAPELRGEYSPAVRRWALEEVDGAQAARIAFDTLRMLFLGGALGKAAGTHSEASAPSVPEPQATTAPTTTEDETTGD